MEDLYNKLIERKLRLHNDPSVSNYEAYISTDHNLIIQDVNQTALSELGYNSKQLIGTSIEGIIKENALESYMKFLNNSLESQYTEGVEEEISLFCSSGKTIRASLHITTLSQSGKEILFWLFQCQKKVKNGSLLQFLSKKVLDSKSA